MFYLLLQVMCTVVVYCIIGILEKQNIIYAVGTSANDVTFSELFGR